MARRKALVAFRSEMRSAIEVGTASEHLQAKNCAPKKEVGLTLNEDSIRGLVRERTLVVHLFRAT